MPGRTVKIFLVDGIPTGVITAEIINWTGKFIIAPRSLLPRLGSRDEIYKTGIYILVGQSEEDPMQEKIYIGESENIWNRLKQHNSDNSKDFWTKTIVVISKDENLTSAHVRYLESRLIQIVRQSRRATLINQTNTENMNLPEPDIADMEYFLEQIEMMLPVLGFSFAIPLPQANENNFLDLPFFNLSYREAFATAQEINGEFIVLKGSTARKAHTNSLARPYIQIRERLKQEGKLVDSQNNDYWEFAENVPFQSPSTAANIISGASLNGRLYWKVRGTNRSYAEWQSEQVNNIQERAPE